MASLTRGASFAATRWSKLRALQHGSMSMPWGLVALVVGVLYGAFKPGRQDKSHLFRQGLMIGLVLAIILAVLGALSGSPALGVAGAVGIILAAIVMTLLFVLGVWLGDLMTASRRRTA